MAAAAMEVIAMRFGPCSMCLDISSDRRYVREAVFPRGEIYAGVEPCLLVVPLELPGDDGPSGDPLPMSSHDPLFQKWFGIFKREAKKP
jgi:hypothetical protein